MSELIGVTCIGLFERCYVIIDDKENDEGGLKNGSVGVDKVQVDFGFEKGTKMLFNRRQMRMIYSIKDY